MVSFQCDGCADTVKKPQLDKHRQRCWASFSCIDCSTTFQGTAYKSHTSCISEAEKYQGKLYKGPKSGPTSAAPSGTSTPAADSPAPSAAAEGTSTIHPSRMAMVGDNSNSNSYDSGYGGYGGRGGRGGRGGFRGRGGFEPRGRGGFGNAGGRPPKAVKMTGENRTPLEGMRSWGSTPAPDADSAAASPAPAAAAEKKDKKRKGDKGGCGSKANTNNGRSAAVAAAEEAPASKKRKFEESESATSAVTAGPPSDKALKRLRKHMSKLEAKSSSSISLAEWLEKVGQGKEKTVDQSDILKGVQVAFVDGKWQLTA